MGITRDTFSSTGWAEYQDVPVPEGGFNDEQRELLYADAVKTTLKAQKKEFTGDGSTNRAIEATLAEFTDARSILGIPEVAEDQQAALTTEGIQSWANNVPSEFHDRPLTEFTNDYITTLKKGNGHFQYPLYRGRSSTTLGNILKENLERDGLIDEFEQPTVGDLIQYSREAAQEADAQADAELSEGTAIGFSVDQAEKLLGSGVQTIGDLIDVKPIADWGKEYAEQQEREIKENNYIPKYKKSFTDTLSDDGVFPALGWTFEKLQENIATSGVALGGAAAAAVAAPISAPLAAVIGGATLAGTSALGVGEVRQELEEKGVYEEGDEAFTVGAGLVIGLIDRIAGSKVIPKGQIFKRLADSGAITKIGAKALTEIGTEEIQEAVSVGTAALNGAEYTAPELINRAIDTAVVSGAIGANFATVDQIVRGGEGPGVSPTDPADDAQQETEGGTRLEEVSGTAVQEDITVPPPSETPQVFKTDSGRTVVASKGRVGVGNNQEEAMASVITNDVLADAKPLPTIEEDAFIIETVDNEDGTSTSTLEVGDTSVTFTSVENAESTIEALTVAHNDPDSDLRLIDGLSITQTDQGYAAEIRGVTGNGTDIESAINTLTDKLNQPDVSVRDVGVVPQQVTPSIELPIKQTGAKRGTFDQKAVVTTLLNNGYFPIQAGPKNVVTEKKVIAYKDGLVYTMEAAKSKDPVKGFKTTIRTLDGEIVQSPLSDASNQLAVDRTGRVLRTGIELAAAPTGIQVRKETVADKEITLIVPETVTKVARETGGEVVMNDGDSAAIRYGDDFLSFIVQDGQVQAILDNDVKIFDGGFDVLDRRNSKRATLTLATNKLLSDGYSIKSAKDGVITLEKEDGSKATLTKEGSKVISTTVDSDGNTTGPARVADIVAADIVQPDDIVQQIQASIPDDMNQQHQEVMGEYMDIDPEAFTVINGKPTVVREDVPTMILDVDPVDTARALDEIQISTFAARTEEPSNSEFVDWDRSEYQEFVDILPQHIKDMVTSHFSPNNPASKVGALGYFQPTGDLGPNIQIDASGGRTLKSVLSTLSEEVAHFSHDSWSVPSLTRLYDIAWDLVGDQAIAGLEPYIKKYSIDVNNPSPSDKWLLVNEYFSKQGTSIIDFVDDKAALPLDVTAAELQQIKREVQSQIVKVELDLTKDFKGDSKEGRSFVRDILRLQAGGVLGRGIVLTYNIDLGKDKANLVVRTSPWGQIRSLVPEGKNAERMQTFKQRFIGKPDLVQRFMKWNTENGLSSFWQTPIGRDNTVLIAGAHQAVSSFYAKGLRGIHAKALKVQAILESHNEPNIPISDSYLATFKRIGVNNKTQLKLAEEMDTFMQDSFKAGYQNVGLIHEEFRQSAIKLREMGLAHGMEPAQIAKAVKELQQQSERYSTDWAHRRYTAYTPEGANDLSQMRRELQAPVDAQQLMLDERIDKAHADIKEVETKLANKKISKSQAFLKIKKLQQPIRIKERLDSLKQWSTNELRGKGTQSDIRQHMENEITRIINKNDNRSGSGNTGKLELIDTVRGRSLDDNNPQDQLYMDFLEPITDPLEVSVHNLEQQNKVLNVLRFNNRLAEKLVIDGVARPKGTSLGSFTADDRIGAFQQGSLLKYIEVDSFWAPFIDDDIKMHDAIDRKVMGEFIGFIKQNITVFNPSLAASNYISNLGIMTMGGHLFYVNKWAQASRDIKSAWTDRLSFTLKKDESIGDSIAREMADNYVLSTGLSTLGVDISDNSVVDRSVQALTKAANQIGLSKHNKLSIDFGVNNFLESMKQIYAFGDDYSKVLPYIMNRELGVSKAESEVDRNDYDDGETGDEAYRKAVLDIAVPFAVERTLRETVVWSVAPKWVRNTVKDKVRFFFGDFLLHPSQVVKMMAENIIIGFEDAKSWQEANVDAKRLNDSGDKKKAKLKRIYANTLRNRIASRFTGNAITYAAGVKLTMGATSLFTSAMYHALGFFKDSDEEEDIPVSEKTWFTPLELDGAAQIANTQSYDGSSLYYPDPTGRKGYTFRLHNGKRSDAAMTLFPVRPDTTDPNSIEYFTGVFQNFFSIDNPTLAIKMANIFINGQDQFGNKLTVEQRLRSSSDLLVPGFVGLTYSILAGERPSGQAIDRTFQLASFSGVRFKEYDVRDTMASIGFRVRAAKESKNNPTRRDMKQRLTSGESLNYDEVINIVNNDALNNEKLMGEFNYAITAHRNYGLSDKEIFKHLQVKANGVSKTGLGKADAKGLVKGTNIFNKSSFNAIGNLIKKNAAKKPTKKFNQEKILNERKALRIAHDQYKKLLTRTIE